MARISLWADTVPPSGSLKVMSVYESAAGLLCNLDMRWVMQEEPSLQSELILEWQDLGWALENTFWLDLTRLKLSRFKCIVIRCNLLESQK